MTKGSAALPLRAIAEKGPLLPSAQPLLSMETPPSPLSSRAKSRDLQFNGPLLEMFLDRVVMGLRPTQGDEKRLLSSNRSPWKRRPPLCHPERTRISCHAAPDTVACAPFSKERRMKFANATKFYRKSGAAEGSAVQRTFRGNVFRQSVVERPAVSHVLFRPSHLQIRQRELLAAVKRSLRLHPGLPRRVPG